MLTHVHRNTYANTLVHSFTSIHTYTFPLIISCRNAKHLYASTNTHTGPHTHTCTHPRIYTHTHIHTNVHNHIRIYVYGCNASNMHIHTCTCCMVLRNK